MMDTSSLSLFPATTTTEFSDVFPEKSRWIFGGSGGRGETLGNLGVGSWALPIPSRGSPEKLGSNSHREPAVQAPSPSSLRPRSPGTHP